jgi:hypothetical protein
MDKQPEASIYIIYFFFHCLIRYSSQLFIFCFGWDFLNFVKKKKTKKNLARDSKKKKENLPPAIINPIISLIY